MRCYLKERDLYGWKCQDARAAVSESSVLVAHFDDHFEKSSFFRFSGGVACVWGGREKESEKKLGSEREEKKIRKFKNKKRNSICRRLRIAKKREKNRVLSSNSFNINVRPQCNLIFGPQKTGASELILN